MSQLTRVAATFLGSVLLAAPIAVTAQSVAAPCAKWKAIRGSVNSVSGESFALYTQTTMFFAEIDHGILRMRNSSREFPVYYENSNGQNSPAELRPGQTLEMPIAMYLRKKNEPIVIQFVVQECVKGAETQRHSYRNP